MDFLTQRFISYSFLSAIIWLIGKSYVSRQLPFSHRFSIYLQSKISVKSTLPLLPIRYSLFGLLAAQNFGPDHKLRPDIRTTTIILFS